VWLTSRSPPRTDAREERRSENSLCLWNTGAASGRHSRRHMSGRAAPPPAQHAGEVICLDSDEEAVRSGLPPGITRAFRTSDPGSGARARGRQGPSRQPAPKPRRSGSGALRPGAPVQRRAQSRARRGRRRRSHTSSRGRRRPEAHRAGGQPSWQRAHVRRAPQACRGTCEPLPGALRHGRPCARTPSA